MLNKKIFIEKLSRVVGLNLSYFLTNGFWVSLRYGFLAITGLLVSISFTHLSSKEFLGQYQFILSFLSVISLLALPGLNISALKSVTQNQEAAIIKTVKISFLASLIGVPIIALWGVYEIFFRDQYLLGSTFIISSLLFPLFNAPNTWYVYYEGKALFKKVVLRTISINVISTTVLILSLFLKVNLLAIVSIYLISNSVMHWMFYIGVVANIKNKKK